jgi:hypothetical protein
MFGAGLHPSREAVQDILSLDFDQADKDRMRKLSAKARAGTLTAKEEAETSNYSIISSPKFTADRTTIIVCVYATGVAPRYFAHIRSRIDAMSGPGETAHAQGRRRTLSTRRNESTSDRLERPLFNTVPALEVNEGDPYNKLDALHQSLVLRRRA